MDPRWQPGTALLPPFSCSPSGREVGMAKFGIGAEFRCRVRNSWEFPSQKLGFGNFSPFPCSEVNPKYGFVFPVPGMIWEFSLNLALNLSFI